jgi:hypothetical protein
MLKDRDSAMLRDTADIREKMLRIWKLVDEKRISSSEARLHISLARTVLETLKVEIAAAHLTQTTLPSVTIGRLAGKTMIEN